MRIRLLLMLVWLLLPSGGLLAQDDAPPLTPYEARAAAARKATPVLIADLGFLDKEVRVAAEERLKSLPRQEVLDAAAALAEGKTVLITSESQVVSVPAVALNLLAQWKDPRAAGIALKQVGTKDGDVRESAASIVSAVQSQAATRFLCEALLKWRTEMTGQRPVLRGLSAPVRNTDPIVQEAVVSFFATPVPAYDAKFRYEDPHDPPQDGDVHRIWLFKADGCLALIAHAPFEAARPGVLKALGIPGLRVQAAAALAELGGDDAPRVIRERLAAEPVAERRLALYRALFVLGADNEQDRLEARNLFTATAAPSNAWVQGLGAMVALFQARGDEPALRVVSIWKLKGAAADMRSAAMQAMQRARPEVYAKVVKPSR